MKDSMIFVTRRIADETIIVPVRCGVGDLNSIYTLNESGTTVFQMIRAGTPVQQIADALCREYEVSTQDAARDIVEFMDRLRALGIIDSPTESVG